MKPEPPPFNSYEALVARLIAINERQKAARDGLEKVDAVLQEAAKGVKAFQRRSIADWETDDDLPSALDALGATLDTATKRTHPGGAISVLRVALDALTKEIATLPRPVPTKGDDPAPKQFDDLITWLDTVTFNQGVLETALTALEATRVSLEQTASIVNQIDPKTALETTPRKFTHSIAEIGRGVTVKISSMNMLSKTVSPLATVVMVWNDTKWEVSGGAIFSWLENRTFQYAPIVVNGQPQLDTAGKVRSVVAATITRPMVVPFALLHYRVTEASISGRRLALLATGGMGVNVGSGTADFAFGGSVSYRLLVLSALIHQGRDLRLSNGVITGSELAGNPTLATERFWRRSKAIGASLRVVF